jgi:TonB family protein
MESEANMVAAAEPQSDAPPAQRLVIRVVLPEGALQAPAQRRPSRAAAFLIAGFAAVLLFSWIGVSIFRSEPTSRPAVSESAPPTPAPVRIEAAPAVSAETLPTPAAADLQPKSVEAEVRPQQDAPPTAVNEVLPPVPQSALDTIRGTVRVSVRVIVDNEGAVLGATAEEPGPSRYFERLSLEASRKWIFAPTDGAEHRVMLVAFSYRRDGVTARASSLQ